MRPLVDLRVSFLVRLSGSLWRFVTIFVREYRSVPGRFTGFKTAPCLVRKNENDVLRIRTFLLYFGS
jgi:hypothetical protein